MTELWSAERAAEYWQVSLSRARAILASRKIKRVSGYPADKIRAVTLRQGARTDLARHDDPDGTHNTPARNSNEQQRAHHAR